MDKKTKISKNEIPWVSYYDSDDELRFLIASSPMRDTYFLYEVKDGKFNKLGKSSSPADLEEKYKVRETLRMKE